MNYRYYFCIPYQPKLISLLNANNIRYKLSGPLGECFSDGVPIPVVVTFEFNKYLPIIDEIAAEFRYKPQVNVVYAAAEINHAALLWMTPKRQSVDLLKTELSFSSLCSWKDACGMRRTHHKEQVGPLTIGKEPSVTAKTAFWASSTGFSEIFTDKRVRELAMEQDLKGVEFVNTMLRNGTFSENIFQLTAQKRIRTEDIVLGHGEKEIVCPMCGKKQYAFDNTYQLHLSLREEELTTDIMTTDRIFGDGIARPLYLISQRFYQLLKQNHLTANVTFEPVAVVQCCT